MASKLSSRTFQQDFWFLPVIVVVFSVKTYSDVLLIIYAWQTSVASHRGITERIY